MFDPMMNANLHRALRQFQTQFEESKPTRPRLLESAGEATSEFNPLAWFASKLANRNNEQARRMKLHRQPE